MSKVIAGFLLGVVVTLAAVYWFDEKPSTVQTLSTDQSLASALKTETQQVDHVRVIENGVKESDRNSTQLKSDGDYADDDPLALQAQPMIAPQRDVKMTNPSRNSSASTTSNQYPPEIADMIENRVNKELHGRYENDRREESWATYMEGQLAAYFAQKPSLAQFNVSLIDCRTSICSVHVLGYGPDALIQWNSATADMVSQPWFEFNNMSMDRRNPQPDILAVVLILTKKPPG